MIKGIYKGWTIEYSYADGRAINPRWVISDGANTVWLNGAMPYDDVLKYIDKMEGGE